MVLELKHFAKTDQKYTESFKMWRWKRMEHVSCIHRVKNGKVLNRTKKERNIVHTIKRRKANRVGHILRRNGLLKHIIEGKI
jgi:hypothetical protein